MKHPIEIDNPTKYGLISMPVHPKKLQTNELMELLGSRSAFILCRNGFYEIIHAKFKKDRFELMHISLVGTTELHKLFPAADNCLVTASEQAMNDIALAATGKTIADVSSECGLIRVPQESKKLSTDELMKLLGNKSGYILFSGDYNSLFYATNKINKYYQNRVDLRYVTSTYSNELRELFPETYNCLVTASKATLAAITELTGHTQSEWRGNDPSSYDKWGQYDEQMALAAIYSEGQYKDYGEAATHYLRSTNAGLPLENIARGMKYMRLAADEGQLGALRFLGTCYNSCINVEETDYPTAIKYYQAVINGTDKNELDEYLYHNQALIELIALYQKNIHTDLLSEYFRVVANKGWPKLYKILGKSCEENKDYKQAIKFYTLYKNKINSTDNRLVYLIEKYKNIHICPYFCSEDGKSYQVINREYESLKAQVDAVDKSLNTLKSIIDGQFDKAVKENNLPVAKNLLALGFLPGKYALHEVIKNNHTDMASLFIRYGVNINEANTEGQIPRELNALCLDSAWNQMNDYFVEVFLVLRCHLNSDIYIPILMNMMSQKQNITEDEYNILTRNAGENIVINEIQTAYDTERANIQNSYGFFSFLKPSNFPQKPTLENILEHAFSNPGGLTLQVLQQKNYIDINGQPGDSAPRAFKRVFNEYVARQGPQIG